MRCDKCGAQNVRGSRYCYSCGAEMRLTENRGRTTGEERRQDQCSILSTLKKHVGMGVLGVIGSIPLFIGLSNSFGEVMIGRYVFWGFVIILDYAILHFMYLCVIYPSYFTQKPKLTGDKKISFLNFLFGGWIFGSFLQNNLDAKKKGIAHKVCAFFVIVPIILACVDFSESNEFAVYKTVKKCCLFAMLGDAGAQYDLGMCYKDGVCVDRNYEKAVKWWNQSAEQGFAPAQFALATCYFSGIGIEENYGEAIKWYRMAAEQELLPAQHSLAICYLNGKGVEQDHEEAVQWFRKAAEQGYVPAQGDLGSCYRSGMGVEQNYREAIKWYRKAAEQGYAVAQNDLGSCYKEGKGVLKDNWEAVKWYRKAAEQGLELAQYNLGFCYMNGEGVAVNKEYAAKWWRKAADKGHLQAQCSLGLCYMNGDGVALNKDKAIKLWRKVANQGLAAAQNNLGFCYLEGNGVERNYKEAVNWFRKAAEQGNAESQNDLGGCYFKGNGVEQNYKEAVKWYRKSAEQGHARAQYNLGICYEKGHGVECSDEEAMKWWRKAAEQGNADAQDRLEQKKAEEKERRHRENLDRIRKRVKAEMASAQAAIEKSNQELEQLKSDATHLEDAISEMAKEYDQYLERAKKRPKKTFYGRAKYVSLLLRNETIIKLYRQYLNESLEVKAEAFRTEVNSVIQTRTAQIENIQKHKRAFRRAQEEERKLLKEVDKLTREYGRYAGSLSGSRGLRGFGKDASQIVAERNLPRVELALEDKKNQLAAIREKIEQYEELVASGESELENPETDENDNAFSQGVQSKDDITSISERYERETVGELKTRIDSRKDLVASQIADAKQKLERLKNGDVQGDTGERKIRRRGRRAH